MEFSTIEDIKKYIKENRDNFSDLLNAEQEEGKKHAETEANNALIDELKGLRAQVKEMQEYNVKHDEHHDEDDDTNYADALISASL